MRQSIVIAKLLQNIHYKVVREHKISSADMNQFQMIAYIKEMRKLTDGIDRLPDIFNYLESDNYHVLNEFLTRERKFSDMTDHERYLAWLNEGKGYLHKFYAKVST